MNTQKLAKNHLKVISTPVTENTKPTHNLLPVPDEAETAEYPLSEVSSFDQPVLLQQSPTWSRGIIWGIMGVTTLAIAWASFAKIEEAVPAQGKLEPKGAVKEIQAPVGGVVKTIYVQDGQKVKEGDLLVSMNPTVPEAQLSSLTNIRNSLLQENQFYRSQMNQLNGSGVNVPETVQAKLKPELVSLTKSRSNLVAENQLYRAELNSGQGSNLNFSQRERLQSSQAELNSRAAAAELEVAQLEKQLMQNRVQLAGAQELLQVNLGILKDVISGGRSKIAQLENQASQNRIKRSGAQKLLSVNEGILKDIEPVAEAGAISRVQLLRQQQEVTTRQTTVQELDEELARLRLAKSETESASRADLLKQQQEVNRRQTEIGQLTQEQARLQLAISQAREKLKNTVAISRKDVLTKISENEQRIADIDSQLTKAIVENEKKISEIDSQLSQAKLSLQYQELRAPVSGKVFDLKPSSPGFVANTTEPVLKIVPDDNLVAKVYITNKDIGFVKEGMEVDVRIDSFPFSEFGDIKGRLVSIGSDALPPDQVNPYYRFPATVRLDKQSLNINGRPVTLQSGMSMSVNIKVRSRTIMSIFTDSFTQQVDGLQNVR